MIPLRLTIKGLYSYREQVEIDFEKLAEGHLFGIFGAVGSGKSAILEAITFALYGKTERLNSSGDNRNYNMMNLQSQDLRIELEFKTTVSGNEERYRFRVLQSRNSKKFDDVKSPSRTAYRWKNNDWEPLPSNDATGILQLSYDNFIKTIIIPQGKFQDFLHMGATDRTRMLREIFALDRFELSMQAGGLSKETVARLDVLKGQLMSLPEANADMIAAQDAQLAALGITLETQKAQFIQLEVETTRHRQLKQLAEETVLIQAKLDLLLTQKAAFELREANAGEFQNAVLHFRELANQESKLKVDKAAAQNAATKIAQELTALLPQIEAAHLAAQAAKLDFEKKEDIEAQIKDCGLLQEVGKATDKLTQIEERLKKGDLVLKDVAAKILDTESGKMKCEAAIAVNRKAMPDITQVNAALLWYQQHKNIHQQYERIAQQILQTKSEQAALGVEEDRLATDRGIELPLGSSVVQAFEQAVAQIKQAIVAARHDKDHIAQREGLGAYALDLSPTSPCPLCGAMDHPSPYDPGEALVRLRVAQEKLTACEAQLASAEKALAVAQNLAARGDEKQKQLQQQVLEHARQQDLRVQHLLTFAWAPYDPEVATQAEADRDAATALQKIIDQEEQMRAGFDQALKKLLEEQKKFEGALQSLREEKSGLAGQRAAHLQQLTVLMDTMYLEKTADALTVLSQQLQSQLDQIVRAFQATQDAERALEKKEVEFQERKLSAETELQKRETEWILNQEQLTRKLAESRHQSLDAVKAILAWNLDLEAEQKAVAHFKGQLQSAQMAIEVLSSRAQGQRHDAAAHAAAESALAASRQQIDQLNEDISLLRNALERLRAAFETRKILESDQSSLQKRLENLKLLEGMFKASGFVKYVSTIYLQELVTRADVRFRKLTRNALSLELGDDSEFLVRDMLNGGQTRSVKTLSGGQTFQASLCMALALADNVQQHSGSSHNFFFLDEGFGTLDKDSLTAVFDTLKQLRQENRIVGVISHVEDLQQEIEIHLKVWQTEERGSLVSGSWE